MRYLLTVADREYDLEVARSAAQFEGNPTFEVLDRADDSQHRVEVLSRDFGTRSVVLRVAGRILRIALPSSNPHGLVTVNGRTLAAECVPEITRRVAASRGQKLSGPYTLRAPLPGRVLQVNARAGQSVNAGELLLSIEAMKMENDLLSPQAGVIGEVSVAAGDTVETNQLLLTIVPA